MATLLELVEKEQDSDKVKYHLEINGNTDLDLRDRVDSQVNGGKGEGGGEGMLGKKFEREGNFGIFFFLISLSSLLLLLLIVFFFFFVDFRHLFILLQN